MERKPGARLNTVASNAETKALKRDRICDDGKQRVPDEDDAVSESPETSIAAQSQYLVPDEDRAVSASASDSTSEKSDPPPGAEPVRVDDERDSSDVSESGSFDRELLAAGWGAMWGGCVCRTNFKADGAAARGGMSSDNDESDDEQAVCGEEDSFRFIN